VEVTFVVDVKNSG